MTRTSSGRRCGRYNGLTIPPTLTGRTVLNAIPRVRWWVDFLTTEPIGFSSFREFDGTVAATGDVVRSGTSDVAGVGVPWLAGTTIYSNPRDSFDIERRDVETLEVVGPPLVGNTLILNAIEDDLDSDRLVTQETNGNVRVWDRESGDQIGLEIAIGRQSSGTGIATARDGDLVGVILDTEFAIWNYDIDSWPELACELAGRNMTRSEWDDFGPQGVEYRATCPQFRANDG